MGLKSTTPLHRIIFNLNNITFFYQPEKTPYLFILPEQCNVLITYLINSTLLQSTWATPQHLNNTKPVLSAWRIKCNYYKPEKCHSLIINLNNAEPSSFTWSKPHHYHQLLIINPTIPCHYCLPKQCHTIIWAFTIAQLPSNRILTLSRQHVTIVTPTLLSNL